MAKYGYKFLAQIKRMFDRADTNHNGQLTQEEWLSLLNSSGVLTTRQDVSPLLLLLIHLLSPLLLLPQGGGVLPFDGP